MMKAAIYIRVSSLEQAQAGYSIPVQKEKLLAYAKAQQYDVVGVYSDEGFSGRSLARPAVERMIGDIKLGKVDIVLIYKLDRLSRRVKDVLNIVEMFEKYNVTLYSLNENIDLSSPFGRAALKMSATFSELERETIVERMQMGKSARARTGKYSCPGRPPFGYIHDKANDRFLINEAEAEAIRKIFDLYINQNFSIRQLYFYCKEAYPDMTYFGNEMCCKPILHRPMYAGYFKYKDELIKGVNFEPIISYETFLKAQTKLEENKSKRIHSNAPNLLAGLVLCGVCGNRYVGKLYDRYSYRKDGTRTKSYKYRVYGCAARIKRDKNYHPAKCDNHIIAADQLDTFIEKQITRVDFSDLKSGEIVPGFIDKLMAELSEHKEREQKLLDLYLDNVIDKDAYMLRLVEIEAKINEIRTVLENEKDKIITTPSDDIVNIIKENIKNYASLSRLEKARLARTLIKNIVVTHEEVIINWNAK